MADYLTRLVERTLGLSPTVRPDIPPAFAPEAGEIAPYDAPGLRPSPGSTLVTRRTDASRQRQELPDRPGPPERPVDDVPVASGEDEGPGAGERGYGVPSSTAGDAAERSEASLARGAGSSAKSSREEREEIQDRLPGPLRDGVEPRADPEEHRRRPAATPPGSVVPDETPEPEGSGALPDLHRTPPPEPPVDVAENLVGASDSSTGLDERHAGQSSSGARQTGRSGTDFKETDAERSKTGTHQRETGVTAASRERGAQMPGVRAHATPPAAEATVPDRRARSGPARSTAPDRPISPAVGPEGRDPRVEREEHERTPEPSVPAANARGRSPTQPATSGRAEHPSGPPARPGPEAPLVSVAGRQRATAASGLVAAHREREAAKATSSPTIRITIGRVEVRAVAPEPAQPPPVASPGPALSLEDYLKRHDGGRG